MIPGACLCGELRYEVEGPVRALIHCHCSRCRRHHGAPFATFVSVREERFRWLSGEESLLAVRSSEVLERAACRTCGAVAPFASGGRRIVPAGNLLGELAVTEALHMFVGSKAPWHEIADDAPQHEGAPPGWSPPAPSPAAPSSPAPSPPAPSPSDPSPLRDGVRGSCLCGAVSFTVRGAPARWLQCHCSRCRRARSAAHGSNTFFPLDRFSWETGEDLVASFRPPDAERFVTSFCRRCGGGAPSVREGAPVALVPAGLLDDGLAARPEAHIHVASKASWYALEDDLPRFAELPPPGWPGQPPSQPRR